MRGRDERIEELRKRLDLEDVDPEMLLEALSHKSWASSRGLRDNERLEFLGDAVLNLLVTEELFRRYKTYPESTLSKLRAELVSNEALSFYANSLNLQGFAFYQGEPSKRILANLMEALIGVIYVSGGLRRVREFFDKHLKVLMERYERSSLKINWRSALQEYVQKRYKTLPEYQWVKINGSYVVKVLVQGEVLSEYQGEILREAKRLAAREALRRLVFSSKFSEGDDSQDADQSDS